MGIRYVPDGEPVIRKAVSKVIPPPVIQPETVIRAEPVTRRAVAVKQPKLTGRLTALRLPPELLAAVDSYAKGSGTTRSAFIRAAIEARLKR